MRRGLKRPCRWLVWLLPGLISLTLQAAESTTTGDYQTPQAFLEEVFGQPLPAVKTVWLSGELKQRVESILGHNYPALRLRYWMQGSRSAWILEEIGKEKPISVGLVIEGETIERVKVLAFRESRGWEIKYPFFTDQFHGVALTNGQQLSKPIDGITGATLSVRAVTRLARMALLLHAQITPDQLSRAP